MAASRPWPVNYHGKGNGVGVEGLDNFVALDMKASPTLIDTFREARRCGDRCSELPDMIFHGSGETVISGLGTFVNLQDTSTVKRRHTRRDSASSGGTTDGDVAECEPKSATMSPPTTTTIPIRQLSEDDVKPVVSEVIVNTSESGPVTPPSPCSADLPSCGVSPSPGRGRMLFSTSDSELVVQGTSMVVISGADDGDASMLASLLLEHASIDITCDVEFESDNSKLCVRGCNTKVFQATGGALHTPSTPGDLDSEFERDVERLHGADTSPFSTTCASVEESVKRTYATETPSLSTTYISSTSVTSKPLATDLAPLSMASPAAVALRCSLTNSIGDYSNIDDIPIARLPFRVRHRLALMLDGQHVNAADWRSLADMFDFSYDVIRYMGRESSPTLCLLEHLQAKGIEVGELLSVLARLDRKDTVTELVELLDAIRDAAALSDFERWSPT